MVTLFWQPGITLESAEREIITQALAYFKGNKMQTANALGITTKTLYNKLETYETGDLEKRDREIELRTKRDEFLRRQRFGTGSGQTNPYASVDPGATNTGRGKEGVRETAEALRKKAADASKGTRPGERAHMEPPAPTRAQHAVSVPVREEVQAVSPKHAPRAGATGRR